ncbi:MAG: zinc-dependent peptidase [Gammaproteobacteria bacterium]
MFERLRRWRENRRLQRLAVSVEVWESAIADWPVAARYRGEARTRLRDMALRFLLRKRFVAADGLEITDAMQLRIATMAAVPVLELGLEWYDGWVTLIIYTGAFIPAHDREDEYGIVHTEREPLTGETSEHGAVILSWEDVTSASGEDAYNVVIHEMAHKLDMCNDGGPNGAPPLHADMDPVAWTRAFTAAWEDLENRADADGDDEIPIDPYALQDAGEFFAVTSECFFEAPARLAEYWPELYRQLASFYRQDPLAQ